MKTLRESLFSKKNLENGKDNKYGITKDDMKWQLEGFPVGVVIRMMEEQELQGRKPDIGVFQKRTSVDKFGGGFIWRETEAGHDFWSKVIKNKNFNLFFDKYPEYTKY